MQIEVDKRYCKGCALCVEVCPKKVLAIGKDRSDRGYLMPEAVALDQCIGCKSCERICPDLCMAVSK